MAKGTSIAKYKLEWRSRNNDDLVKHTEEHSSVEGAQERAKEIGKGHHVGLTFPKIAIAIKTMEWMPGEGRLQPVLTFKE